MSSYEKMSLRFY